MPQMKDKVEEVVKGCDACQRTRATFDGHHPILHPLPIMGPYYRWSLDLATMPHVTKRGNKYVVVMIEHYSRYIELAAIPDKEAKHVAAVFRECVIARYGGCAEVLTDNGGEFSKEFTTLLQETFIDHRLITPQHSQSNGLAERCVQTVKRALKRMAIGVKMNHFQWDDHLCYIQLGYNCSKQESTKLSPYRVTFAHDPIIPSEAAQKFMQLWKPAEGDKEDVINGQSAEIDLIIRARLVQQYNVIAGQNLAIAQQRDTLRYARVRSGDYRPIEHKYKIGQYVFVKHKQVTALQPKAREGLYRIQDLRDNGVVILEGTDGTTFKDHVEHLAPCHLPVKYIDTKEADSSALMPSEDLPCEVCRQTSGEAEMILCDSCNTGWHLGCLNPSLNKVPKGDWFCPNCSLTEGKQSKFLKRIKGQAIATQWLDNRYVRPIMEAEGNQFKGLRVRKLFDSASNRQGKHYYGTLQYLADPADPALKGTFKINFDDGDEEYNDWTGLQADKRLVFVDKNTALPLHNQANPTLQPQDTTVARVTTSAPAPKRKQTTLRHNTAEPHLPGVGQPAAPKLSKQTALGHAAAGPHLLGAQ